MLDRRGFVASTAMFIREVLVSASRPVRVQAANWYGVLCVEVWCSDVLYALHYTGTKHYACAGFVDQSAQTPV